MEAESHPGSDPKGIGQHHVSRKMERCHVKYMDEGCRPEHLGQKITNNRTRVVSALVGKQEEECGN